MSPVTQPALAPTLEALEIDKIMASYENASVPPGVPQEDFGRGVLRAAFVSGFGSMLAIATRLNRETPERRAAILEKLEGQMWVAARQAGGGAEPS